MKLSKHTLNILKNFSAINPSIAFKMGNRMKTMSVLKNIVGDAIIEENFPINFAINDLNQFQNSISLFDDPELDFSNEKYLTIFEKNNKLKYYFGDASLFNYPEKELALPSTDVTFSLDKEVNLLKLLKASATQSLPDLAVVADGSIMQVIVRDRLNPTTNEYSINVGSTTKSFEFNFKIENLKLYPGPYDVEISRSKISKFVHQDLDLTYWIALEPDVKYAE